MADLSSQVVDLWSREIAKLSSDIGSVKAEVSALDGEAKRALVAKCIREHFVVAERVQPDHYAVDDLPHFMHWLDERLDLPTGHQAPDRR